MATQKSIWRKITVAVCAVMAVVFGCTGAFFLYVSDYYRADETALVVAKEEHVHRTEEGYLLSSKENSDTAFIFYPGAKVEFNA